MAAMVARRTAPARARARAVRTPANPVTLAMTPEQQQERRRAIRRRARSAGRRGRRSRTPRRPTRPGSSRRAAADGLWAAAARPCARFLGRLLLGDDRRLELGGACLLGLGQRGGRAGVDARLSAMAGLAAGRACVRWRGGRWPGRDVLPRTRLAMVWERPPSMDLVGVRARGAFGGRADDGRGYHSAPARPPRETPATGWCVRREGRAARLG